MELFRADRYIREVKSENSEPETQEQQDRLILEAAYRKALDTESDQIDIKSFSDLYGENSVGDDIKKVKELQEHFRVNDQESSLEARKIGKILEMIVNEQIELNNWFGEGARTQQTTDFIQCCPCVVPAFEETGAFLASERELIIEDFPVFG